MQQGPDIADAGARVGAAPQAVRRGVARVGGALRRLMRDAGQSIWPSYCTVCDCDAPPGCVLCAACLAEVREMESEGACAKCGKPVPPGEPLLTSWRVPGGATPGQPPGASWSGAVQVEVELDDPAVRFRRDIAAPCPWCAGGGVGRISHVARLGWTAGPLRTLIHQLKYRGRWELAPWLASQLLGNGRVHELMSRAEVVVPVPLHAARKASRGYNQAELIARPLATRLGLKLAQPAVRSRYTAAQTALRSVTARQANLRGAFVLIDPAAVEARRVVLVDDVTTTGSTLRSFANTLWAARPASITAVVVAVTDPRVPGLEDG